jgi:hypothetical protein
MRRATSVAPTKVNSIARRRQFAGTRRRSSSFINLRLLHRRADGCIDAVQLELRLGDAHTFALPGNAQGHIEGPRLPDFQLDIGTPEGRESFFSDLDCENSGFEIGQDI